MTLLIVPLLSDFTKRVVMHFYFELILYVLCACDELFFLSVLFCSLFSSVHFYTFVT